MGSFRYYFINMYLGGGQPTLGGQLTHGNSPRRGVLASAQAQVQTPPPAANEPQPRL